jgi:hypothetical protein
VLLLALLAAMILPGRVSNAAGPVGPGTRDFAIVTGLPDGLPTPLAGAGAIRDASVIWISPADGIEQVRYFIDPASSNLEYGAVRGKPVAVATEAPFALQLDLESLSHGPHTLVAAIDLADGRTVVKTARGEARGESLVFAGEAAATAADAASPLADCAPLACSQVKVAAPYTLTFDSDRGGLEDKNGVGTGFTWVDKPTAGGTGYIPANLEVNTTAGVLSITTTPGIAFLGENNQDNALGVGIDAARQVSALETRLVNFPAMTGELEQAGLWYGTDDDNYLKLVVISEPEGPRIQFVEERNGALQQQVVTPVISLAGGSAQLRLRADPVRLAVTAYYGLNGGALQEFHTFQTPPELFNSDSSIIDPAVGTGVFGGVFASDRFLQGVAVFQFDYFTLTAEAPVLRAFLPMLRFGQ